MKKILLAAFASMTLIGNAGAVVAPKGVDRSNLDRDCYSDICKLPFDGVQDNARLYADNSKQNYDTLFFYGNTPRLTVSGGGQLELNGSNRGAGISMLGLSRGTVNVYGGGSIVINGSKSCIEAPAVVIGGGSMELNACDGGQVIKTADKDENFESGYFVSGEVLSHRLLRVVRIGQMVGAEDEVDGSIVTYVTGTELRKQRRRWPIITSLKRIEARLGS